MIVHNVTERFNELSSEVSLYMKQTYHYLVTHQILYIISFLESEKNCDQVVKCMKSVQEIEAEKLSLVSAQTILQLSYDLVYFQTKDAQIQRKSINDYEGDEEDLEETKKR